MWLINGVNQKNFGLFFTTWLDTPAAQPLPILEENKLYANVASATAYQTDRSDKSVIKKCYQKL